MKNGVSSVCQGYYSFTIFICFYFNLVFQFVNFSSLQRRSWAKDGLNDA